jgi:tetratricopeptide (TPR) repeat protein
VTIQHRYKAFISYSHRDSKWARWLHRSLENYRVPRRLIREQLIAQESSRLSPIFRDREEMATSASLSERIEEALENSEYLIVLCSPDAAQSRWVNEEIAAFKRMGRSRNILCLIVGGDPASRESKDYSFPPALFLNEEEGGELESDFVEPAAADARKIGDGKSVARLKIVAALLGIGLDELRRRDYQRRQKRLALITTSSVVIASLTVVLAVTASVARNEAERRRQQAEDLLGFMVGDLRSRLTPIGRLDLLESVGDRAMQYFATVDVANLSDEELTRQAQVFTQIGEIRVDQNDYSEALASFTEAYERSRNLSINAPRDGERIFNRGQAEFWIGFVHWRNRQLASAMEWMERYRDTSLELVAIDPGRNDWRREVGYAYHNLAVFAEEKGDLVAAQRGYQFLLSTLEEIGQQDDSVLLRNEIANTVSWLGNVAWNRGNLSEALEYYQQSLQRYAELFEENDSDAEVQWAYSWALYRVAATQAELGLRDESMVQINHATDLIERLVALDETNTSWQIDLLSFLLMKGEIEASRGDMEAAAAVLSETDARITELESQGYADISLLESTARSHRLGEWVYAAQGALENALIANYSALENIESMLGSEEGVPVSVIDLVATQVSRARLLREAGRIDDAEQILGLAEAALNDYSLKPNSPNVLETRARLYQQTGREDQANLIRSELQSRGYRPLRGWDF